jgi:hypothetical protein
MSGYTTIALTVIGTTMSVIGQLKQGADAERAANRNAGVLFQNANAARLAANENAKRQRRLAGKRAGTNRALDPDKIDLLEDTALEEELAIQSLVHAGEVEAIGFENRAQSEIARGKNAKSNSVFGAFSSILMGAASLGAGSADKAGSTIQFNPGNFNPVSGGGGTGSPLVLRT